MAQVGQNVVIYWCIVTQILSRISEILSGNRVAGTQFMHVKQVRHEQHTRFKLESKNADI